MTAKTTKSNKATKSTLTANANDSSVKFDALQSALNNRIANAENENQVKNLKAELKMFTLPILEYAIANGLDVEKLTKTIAISEKKDANYLAIYALQKVRKTLSACAQGLKSSLDGYTRTIVNNLAFNEQNNKSALVSLSKAIEFNEFDTQKKITVKYGCKPSTASTQMSSTRQALMLLNIATVTKRKNNDEFALTDSLLANRLKSLFVA